MVLPEAIPGQYPYSMMGSKGRTELQISLSGAKNAEKAAGDVRFCVSLQKMGENAKNRFFDEKNSPQRFPASKIETLGIV